MKAETFYSLLDAQTLLQDSGVSIFGSFLVSRACTVHVKLGIAPLYRTTIAITDCPGLCPHASCAVLQICPQADLGILEKKRISLGFYSTQFAQQGLTGANPLRSRCSHLLGLTRLKTTPEPCRRACDSMDTMFSTLMLQASLKVTTGGDKRCMNFHFRYYLECN